MAQFLIYMKAQRLVEIGRPILARLEADPRMPEAARSMRTAQDALEARVDTLETAAEDERLARVRRDEDRRVFAAEVREFGFIVLSAVGNHHDADPYLLYFPEGYGELRHLTPALLASFGQELLAKLAKETAPKLLPRREQLEAALNRFLASEQAYEAAKATRAQAFALVKAEKRSWTRGIVKVRAIATSECHFERAYVRMIFAGIASHRKVAEESPEPVEVPPETTATLQVLPVPSAVAPPDDLTMSDAA